MSKIIAMIPARIGSQRVPKKNLRLLNGKPLISYSIDAAKESGVFNEIYVNSESDIFGEIALNKGIRFYKRPDEFASNSSNNDDFAFDFIKNVNGDILIQLVPTSPLISPQEIKGFVNEMIKKEYDTLISVVNHQIACIYKDYPINFKLLEPHISSQQMIPVQSYATVLMGWKYETFIQSMSKYGFAYHGADTKIGYFPLKGFSEIDIDNEEDFNLAEIAIRYKENISKNIHKQEYYESKKRNN
jgi:CMP-N,N'-diacetyllegionaminic acid synthase